MRTRSILAICLLSFLFVCGCAVSKIHSPMASNPLKKIAADASRTYTVRWIDDNTLEITDPWPIASVLSLGYAEFHADLRYEDNILEGDYYLQSNNLFFLFLPVWTDAQLGLFGLQYKPFLRYQTNEVLGYAGSSMQASTIMKRRNKSVIQ